MKATRPVQARKIETTKSRLQGLLGFGVDNLFPQTLLEIIGESVTARACLGVRSRFIEGNGLLDAALARMVVHRSGMRLDELIRRTAKNVATFEVVCLLVQYNALGQIAGLRPVPVEVVRLGEPDDYGVVSKAGICLHLNDPRNKSKRDKFTTVNLFDPDPQTVLKQIELAGGIHNYPGQLIYEPVWEPGDDVYHIPSFSPAIRDMETEGELSIYDYSSATQGFSVSGFFAYLSDPTTQASSTYNPLSDPDSVEYQIAQGQGGAGAGRVVAIRARSIEELEAMRFIDSTGANLDKRYEATNERVARRITAAFQTPAVLANLAQGNTIFPDSQALATASTFMQGWANPYQRKISEVLSAVFANWQTPIVSDFQIENLKTFANANPG